MPIPLLYKHGVWQYRHQHRLKIRLFYHVSLRLTRFILLVCLYLSCIWSRFPPVSHLPRYNRQGWLGVNPPQILLPPWYNCYGWLGLKLLPVSLPPWLSIMVVWVLNFPKMFLPPWWTDWALKQSSGAAWKSRSSSWAPRPNEPYGFCGRKATLSHALALVTVCP